MIRLAATLLLAALPAFGTIPGASRTAIDQITGIKGVYGVRILHRVRAKL